jgi:hypothetical protein
MSWHFAVGLHYLIQQQSNSFLQFQALIGTLENVAQTSIGGCSPFPQCLTEI